MLGSKLPDAAGVLLGFLGDIGQFLRGQNLADVLCEVVQETFLASYIASSDSIGYMPPACGVEVRLGIDEHVLVRFEVDSGLRIGRSANFCVGSPFQAYSEGTSHRRVTKFRQIC